MAQLQEAASWQASSREPVLQDAVVVESEEQTESPPEKVGGLFAVFILSMVAVNYDSGATSNVLPLMSKGCPDSKGFLPEFATEFPCLTVSDQGILGALPYIGICLGCPLVGWLLQRGRERLVICSGLLLNAFACAAFGYVIQKYPLFISKLCIGFAHSAICVYVPVWVDCFSPPAMRVTWLGIVQGIGSLGAMVGYGFAGFMVASGVYYQWAFRIQSGLIFVCISLLFCSPARLVNVSMHAVAITEDVPVRSVTRSFVTSFHGPGTSPSKGCKLSLCQNGLFMFTSLGLCTLFFVMTAVQFWATNFFEVCFRQDQAWVTTIFLLVSISAPVAGVFTGGAIIDCCTDGILEKQARILGMWALVAALAGFAAASVPVNYTKESFYGVVSCVWVLLFFGAMMLPPCTGVVLQSVPESKRPMANAFSMLLYNSLGYASGAFVPGQIAQVLQHRGWSIESSLHVAMQVVFAGGAGSGLFCMILMYLAVRRRMSMPDRYAT